MHFARGELCLFDDKISIKRSRLLNLNLPAKLQLPLMTTAAKRGETPRMEKLAFGASSIVAQPSMGLPATANTRKPF
jgi:hypothetical protein